MMYAPSVRSIALLGFVLLIAGRAAGAAQTVETALDTAIAGAHRSAENRHRDRFRHPQGTLSFFGLQPNMKVLEVLPGTGWYTEILAAVLQAHGQLTVASFGAKHSNDYLRNIHIEFIRHIDSMPEVYGRVNRVLFRNKESVLPDIADVSQDMVLTFRNTHNWIRFGGIEEIYRGFHRVLRPGGVLGVVQHRTARGSDAQTSAEQGYVPEGWLIRLLEDIGFELVAKSEINANPKDTRVHPEGVWTLPPALRMGDTDRAKYIAIGESDRMTLKFVKLP